MARWKTVYDCEGCKHFKTPNGGRESFCHYATDTGACRVINRKVVPAEKCFVKKIFFQEK